MMSDHPLPTAKLLFRDPVTSKSLPKTMQSVFPEGHSQVKLPRLMQRVGAEPGRPPNTAPWFNDPQSTYRHHAEYLNRLRKLRQDLIHHEHERLTKALERFQLRDSDSTFHLSQRIPGRAVFKLNAHNALPVRSYSNASKKFRRGKRNETPRLDTIQGKQLLEPQVEMEPEDTQPSRNAGVDKNEIDLTVKENLKRLLQPKPSCSIPSVGWKNFKSNTSSSEKGSSTDSSGSQNSPRSLCVRRSHTHHKFPLTNSVTRSCKKQLTKADSDELDLSPSMYKFERLNRPGLYSRRAADHNKQMYNVFYVPPSPDHVDDDPKSCEETDDTKETEAQPSQSEHTLKLSKSQTVLPLIASERSPRRRIVVDMPDIILYPATPDIEANCVDKGGQLTKALKQNQLRQREISNLLEDVKEISSRTESLENNYITRGP